jgi:hypothetical protein
MSMAWLQLSGKSLSPQVPVVARRRGLTHPQAKGARPRPRARAPQIGFDLGGMAVLLLAKVGSKLHVT